LLKGDEGGFYKEIEVFITHKISPTPSLPKRGIREEFIERCSRP